MNGGRDGHGSNGRDSGDSIDDLLDRAVAAINRGDHATASALAGQVLSVDGANVDAGGLLADDQFDAGCAAGEIRRLTILFADLVDSTALSTRVEPETYRLVVGRYREQVSRIVERFEGHIGSTKGDGLLAVFGHPTAHEDDARRAAAAGLEITREVRRLSEAARRRFGIDIQVRVGVHRGLVYLDTAQDDVYGLAANVAARVSSLAPPGTVVVSEAVASLIGKDFEMEARPPALVKGVDAPVVHLRILGEQAEPVRISGGPLVGRDRELAHLQKSWTCAKAGTLTTPAVVFRGEPGIGKSRLAVAATELVEGSGALALELTGSPLHSDVGLYPIRTLIERRCGIARLTDPVERMSLLSREVATVGLAPEDVVPFLAPVLGLLPEHGYEPVSAEGHKLYELIAAAMRMYLSGCFGSDSGLLVVEDVHWFDPATLEVLGLVLQATQGRLLVVMTTRPDGWSPTGWLVKVIDLEPLTDEQTDELITSLNPNLTVDARAQVSARCDGVPFHIEQVVSAVQETGVPEALYEPLLARLRAGANVVPVLEAAAVIGRHIDQSLLAAAVDVNEADLDDVLDELENARVLEPWGTGSWRFRHELLREVAAELAPPSVRRRLHAKVADLLVAGGGGEPDWRLAAGHYERAERFDDAAAAYQQASAVARRRGALAEARTYLNLCLTQLGHATPGPDRDRRESALRLERGLLSSAAEGYQSREAAADFERCLQLGGTNLLDDELFATLTAVGNYYLIRADLQRAAHVLEVMRTPLEGRQWFRPATEILFGAVAWQHGEFDAACSHLEAATADLAAADERTVNAEPLLVSESMAQAGLYLALVALVRGDVTKAEAELALSAHRAKGLGFPQGPYMHAYIRSMDTWLRIEAGQLDRAGVLAADIVGEAVRYGLDMWPLVGSTWQAAMGALAALDVDRVDPTALGAHTATLATHLDTLRTLEVNMYTTVFDAVLGRLLTAAGRPQEARERLDVGLKLGRDTGMRFYDAELLRLRAHTHTDPDVRRADLTAALELARRQGAILFELRAALEDFELRGRPACAALATALSRMPCESTMPEAAMARAALESTNSQE